jgi:hypothetical protein
MSRETAYQLLYNVKATISNKYIPVVIKNVNKINSRSMKKAIATMLGLEERAIGCIIDLPNYKSAMFFINQKYVQCILSADQDKFQIPSPNKFKEVILRECDKQLYELINKNVFNHNKNLHYSILDFTHTTKNGSMREIETAILPNSLISHDIKARIIDT